jgi:hypothetical protein
VKDAAGAECWAFYVTLVSAGECECPHVVTDCYNILTMLCGGMADATGPSRPLARVWNMIAPILDGAGTHELVNKRVVWMPSHCTTASIGTTVKSNGRTVTAMDWRANRLVDKLAKNAARAHCVPDLAVNTFEQALCAAEYYAALAGTVTYAGNHFAVDVVRRNGTIGRSIVRDSCPGVRPKRDFKTLVKDDPPPCAAPLKRCRTGCHQPGLSSSDVPKVATAQALHAARGKKARLQTERSAEQRFQSAWRENRDKRSASAPPRMTAKDRVDALRRRILGS